MSENNGKWEPCDVTVSFTDFETGRTQTRTVVGEQRVGGKPPKEYYDRWIAYYRQHGIPFGATPTGPTSKSPVA